MLYLRYHMLAPIHVPSQAWRLFYLTPRWGFGAPVGGWPHQNFTVGSPVGKLEWWGHQAIKKFDGKFRCFDTIHQRDGQRTDGRTNEHRTTAKTALCIASCGKNENQVKRTYHKWIQDIEHKCKKPVIIIWSIWLFYSWLLAICPHRRSGLGCCVDSRPERRVRDSPVSNSWRCGRSLPTNNGTSPTSSTSDILPPLLMCRIWCCEQTK